MRFKKLLSVAMASALCLSLMACEQDKSGESGDSTSTSIVLTESWDFSSSFYTVLSAANSNNYGSTFWNRNFYDTLVSYDHKGEIQGSLAETYDISEDGLTYTFHLRKGIKFSDGTPLTAEAVKQSVSAAIANLGTFNGSYGKLTTIIKQMEAIDEHTFQMTLESPYYGTLNDLTMCNPLGIVNPKAFEKGVEKAQENCMIATMGTGPYMYKSFENSTYTFVRNPNYWGEMPELDSFQVKVIEDNDAKVLAVRSGEIDAILGSSRMSFDGFKDFSVDEGYGTSVDKSNSTTRYLGFNLATEPFNDILVRQAVAYAVDQQSLEKSVFSGAETAAEVLFSKDKAYCDVKQTTYNTDVDKAKALMEKAGWVDKDGDGIREKDGKNLEIKLSYTQGLSSIDDAALAIASQLENIGFKVTPAGSDMMSWYGDIMAGKYTMAFWYTYGGVFDPTTVMTNINPSTSADPIAMQFAPSIPGGASAIEELNSTSDLERVQEIYEQTLQAIADKCLIVPITYTHEMASWNKEKIESYDYYYDSNYVNVAGINLKK